MRGEANQDSHFSRTTRFQGQDVSLRDQEDLVRVRPDPMKVLSDTSLLPFYRSLKMEKEALENLKNKLPAERRSGVGGDPDRREKDVKLIKNAMADLINTKRFTVEY